MFAANGALGFDDREHSGLWGDVILVNGKPWPVMKVQKRVYRFRILNASVSRSYNFRLSTGDPVTVVATDAGPDARGADGRVLAPRRRRALRDPDRLPQVRHRHPDRTAQFVERQQPRF